MQLQTLDWVIALASVAICFAPALFFGKRSGKSTAEFFASGRSVPWWLAGLSMVATTFSSDTPNLVTDIVRRQGVAGNWVWWAFVLTGVATVFFYARLWRRSGVMTDLEFYEIRYSGKAASVVRGIPRGVPGPALQLHDHGHREPGGLQDRGHPVRARALADAAVRRRAERRFRRALRPVGRAGDRHDPVLHQDDRGDRGRLLRAPGPAGRRPAGAGQQALRDAGPGRDQLPERAAGLLEQLGPGGGDLHHADRGPVVGGLVSRRRARRRQLHRAADARLQVREGRARRGAVLQRRPLRAAALAVDPDGALLDPRLPAAVGHPGARSPTSTRACSATTSRSPRC